MYRHCVLNFASIQIVCRSSEYHLWGNSFGKIYLTGYKPCLRIAVTLIITACLDTGITCTCTPYIIHAIKLHIHNLGIVMKFTSKVIAIILFCFHPFAVSLQECHFSSFRFGILLHPCSAIEAIFIGHHIILLISEINYCLDIPALCVRECILQINGQYGISIAQIVRTGRNIIGRLHHTDTDTCAFFVGNPSRTVILVESRSIWLHV